MKRSKHAATSGGTPTITLAEKIFVLNFYGTALLLGAPVCAAAAAVLSDGLLWPVLAFGACSAWGISVTARLPSKVRIASTLLKRIERRGFRPEYFRGMCNELCMRKLTALVLHKVGRRHQYESIRRVYGAGSGAYIEHSSPELEDLIARGHIREEDVLAALAQGLEQRR